MPFDENDLPKYKKKDRLAIVMEFLHSNRGTAYSVNELFESLFKSDFKKYIGVYGATYTITEFFEIQMLDNLLRSSEDILHDEIMLRNYYYLSRSK